LDTYNKRTSHKQKRKMSLFPTTSQDHATSPYITQIIATGEQVLVDDDIISADEALHPAKSGYDLGTTTSRFDVIYVNTVNALTTTATTNITANSATITDLYTTNIGVGLLEVGTMEINATNTDAVFVLSVNETAKFSQGCSYSGDDYLYIRDDVQEKDRLHISPSALEIYDNSASSSFSVDFATGTATFGENVLIENYLIVGDALEIGTSLILDSSTSNTIDRITTTKDTLLLDTDSGANLELTKSGSIYYDGVAHYFRDYDGSPTYLTLSSDLTTIATNVNITGSLEVSEINITDFDATNISVNLGTFTDISVANINATSTIECLGSIIAGANLECQGSIISSNSATINDYILIEKYEDNPVLNIADAPALYLFCRYGANSEGGQQGIYGAVNFGGSDTEPLSTDYSYTCASIVATSDGQDMNTDDFPGCLEFYTTEDGTATLSKRVKIPHTGGVQIYYDADHSALLSVSNTNVLSVSSALTVGTNLTVNSTQLTTSSGQDMLRTSSDKLTLSTIAGAWIDLYTSGTARYLATTHIFSDSDYSPNYLTINETVSTFTHNVDITGNIETSESVVIAHNSTVSVSLSCDSDEVLQIDKDTEITGNLTVSGTISGEFPICVNYLYEDEGLRISPSGYTSILSTGTADTYHVLRLKNDIDLGNSYFTGMLGFQPDTLTNLVITASILEMDTDNVLTTYSTSSFNVNIGYACVGTPPLEYVSGDTTIDGGTDFHVQISANQDANSTSVLLTSFYRTTF
jgi:hypothetical protein